MRSEETPSLRARGLSDQLTAIGVLRPSNLNWIQLTQANASAVCPFRAEQVFTPRVFLAVKN